MRAALALVGLVAAAAAAVAGGDGSFALTLNELRLNEIVWRLTNAIQTPWTPIGIVAQGVASGAVADLAVPGDLAFCRSQLWDIVRTLRNDSAVYMMYLGAEADGSFVGYYNEGQSSRGPDFYYTLLDGWNCDWEYATACGGDAYPCPAGYPGANPACRRYYDVDQRAGLPACAAGAAPVPAAETCFYDAPYRASTYDPRARPWYVAAKRRPSKTSWSSVYVFSSDQVPGVTAAIRGVQETPSISLQHDFVRVDASDLCVQILRTRAEMINGPRRSRIGPKLTEIRASKVGKTRKTPGFPGHRRGTAPPRSATRYRVSRRSATTAAASRSSAASASPRAPRRSRRASATPTSARSATRPRRDTRTRRRPTSRC